MKLALFLLLAASLAASETFPVLKTTKGVEYKNARVSEVEADGITIFHAGGVAKILFRELSPEMQKKFGYEPKAAAAAERADLQAQARLAEQARRDAETARRAQQAKDEATAAAMRAAEAKRVAGGAVGGVDSLKAPTPNPNRPKYDGMSLAEQQALRKAETVERLRRQIDREETVKDSRAAVEQR